MANPPDETVGAVLASVRADGVQSFKETRQQNVLVCLLGLCTDSAQAVVGQRQMGQARQMQVPFNPLLLLHLVFAQPERSLQFLEQDLDRQASLVSRDVSRRRTTSFVG